MSNIDYTVDGVIADVKRSGAIPTHQSLFDEDDFVATLSDEMKTVLTPMIMSTQENHFLAYYDQTIVSGQDAYEMPWRAMGNKLKTLQIIKGDSIITLPKIDLRDTGEDATGADVLHLSGFRLEGTSVVLYPSDNWVGETLRMYYFRRPNNLVPTSQTGKIVAINTGTNEVQLDNVPSEWTTADTLDVIDGTPPFKAVGEEQVITAIAGFDVTFDSLPTNMAVGDYVALKGQSPIPQIPYDMFPLLAQRGVCSVMGTLSPQQSQAAEQAYGKLHKTYLGMIAPRIDDAPKKLVNRRGLWNWRN